MSEIVYPGRRSRAIVALNLQDWATWPWTAPGGSSQHPGSLEPGIPAQRYGNNVVQATQVILQIADNYFAQPGPRQ